MRLRGRFGVLVSCCLAVVGVSCSAALASEAIHIKGGTFIGVTGRPLRLIGVDRSGSEYACTAPLSDGSAWGFGIFQGPTDSRSIEALLSWDVDAVGRYGRYQTAGQQAMVDAIRDAGARQPIVISGPNFAGDLSGWDKFMPHDPLHQLAADISSFDYGDYVLGHERTLRSFARSHPVIIGGFGDTNCTSIYSRKVTAFMDSIKQSYLAWTWNTVQELTCDRARRPPWEIR